MTTLTSPRMRAIFSVGLTGGADPAPTISAVNHTANPALDVGTADSQIDLSYSASLTVTTGTPLVLDLDALTDPLGGTVNFAEICGILVSNGSVTAGQDLTVGGGTNPIIGAQQPIQPQGFFAHASPVTGIVVDATHKNLQITVAAGTAVPIKVTVFGRSA